MSHHHNDHGSKNRLVITLIIIGFVLGCWGYFIECDPHQPWYSSLANSVYETFGLFELEIPYGFIEKTHHHLPWQLEIARWMIAFGVLGFVFGLLNVFHWFNLLCNRYRNILVVAILRALFQKMNQVLGNIWHKVCTGERFVFKQLVRLVNFTAIIQSSKSKNFNGELYIICGAGERGFHILSSIRETEETKNQTVIVIEKDATKQGLERFVKKGALLIFGSALDSKILQKAGVLTGCTIFIVTNDDLVNLSIVGELQKLVKGKPVTSEIKCYVNHQQNGFYDRLNQLSSDRTNLKFKVKAFNTYDNAVNKLMESHSFTKDLEAVMRTQLTSGPHKSLRVLVVGADLLGQTILVKLIQVLHLAKSSPVTFTLADHDIERKIQQLYNAFPILSETYCQKYSEHYAFRSEGQNENELLNYWKIAPLKIDTLLSEVEFNYDLVIVAIDGENQMLLANQLYSAFVAQLKSDIFVFSSEKIGLYEAIIDTKAQDHNSLTHERSIRQFGFLHDSCSLEMILNSDNEEYAKSNNKIHDAKKPWDELSMFEQDSNRYQGLFLKLIVGAEIKPLLDEMFKKDVNQEHSQDGKSILDDICEEHCRPSQAKGAEKQIEEDFKEFKEHERFYELLGRLGKENLINLIKSSHRRWNTFQLLHGFKTQQLDDVNKTSYDKRKDELLKTHSCITSWERKVQVSEYYKNNFKSGDTKMILNALYNELTLYIELKKKRNIDHVS